MAAVELFSVAANAFSVVGLVDVLIRSSYTLAGLVSRAGLAGSLSSRLTALSKDLILVVSEVQSFAKAYRASGLTAADGNGLPQGLDKVLSDCDKEVQKLIRYLSAVDTSRTGGFVQRWTANLGFALQEEELRKSMQILEAYKTTILALLAIHDSKTHIVIQKQLEETEKKISNSALTVQSHIQDLEQTIDAFASETRQSTKQTITLIESSQRKSENIAIVTQDLVSESSELIMRNISDLHSSIQDDLALFHARNTDTALQTQSLIGAVQKTNEETLKRQNSIAKKAQDSSLENALVLRQLRSEIRSDFEKHLANHFSSLIFAHDNSRDVIFEGRDLHSILISLMYIKPDLPTILDQLAGDGKSYLTQSDVCWVDQEFRNLLLSAHEIAALELRTRRMSDSHSVPESRSSSRYHVTNRNDQSRTTQVIMEQQVLLALPRSVVYTFSHKYYTEVGTIMIQCSITNFQDTRREKQHKYIEFRFAHFATSWRSTRVSGVFGLFSRQSDTTVPIGRYIQEINIVRSGSKVFAAVRNDDVAMLQDLLSNKHASPFDYDELGRSLLYVAAAELSPNSMALLMREGADPYNCHLGASSFRELFSALWSNIGTRMVINEKVTVPAVVEASTLAFQNGYEFDFGDAFEHIKGAWNWDYMRKLLLNYEVSKNNINLLLFIVVFSKSGILHNIRELHGKNPGRPNNVDSLDILITTARVFSQSPFQGIQDSTLKDLCECVLTQVFLPSVELRDLTDELMACGSALPSGGCTCPHVVLLMVISSELEWKPTEKMRKTILGRGPLKPPVWLMRYCIVGLQETTPRKNDAPLLLMPHGETTSDFQPISIGPYMFGPQNINKLVPNRRDCAEILVRFVGEGRLTEEELLKFALNSPILLLGLVVSEYVTFLSSSDRVLLELSKPIIQLGNPTEDAPCIDPNEPRLAELLARTSLVELQEWQIDSYLWSAQRFGFELLRQLLNIMLPHRSGYPSIETSPSIFTLVIVDRETGPSHEFLVGDASSYFTVTASKRRNSLNEPEENDAYNTLAVRLFRKKMPDNLDAMILGYEIGQWTLSSHYKNIVQDFVENGAELSDHLINAASEHNVRGIICLTFSRRETKWDFIDAFLQVLVQNWEPKLRRALISYHNEE